MIKALFPITAGATVALLLTVPPAVAALDAPVTASADRAQDEQRPDRALTRAEATAMAAQLFDRLDANHDGRIDAADREARFAAMRARFEAERAAHLAARFDAIDTNHDGAISRAEFLAAHDHGPGWGHDAPPPPPMAPPPMTQDAPPQGLALGYDAPGAPVPRGAWHGGPGPRGAQGPGRPGRGPRDEDPRPDGPHGEGFGRRHHGPMLVGLIMRTADPQHTGTVTRAAFIAAAQQLFDRADTNHDGTLTPDERHAAQRLLRDHMRAAFRDHRDGRYGPPPGGPDDGPPPPPPHD